MAVIIVLGSGGMLGRAFVEEIGRRGDTVVHVPRSVLDLASPEAVARLDVTHADLVVNCAAWTDVDGAESDERGAWRVNAEAVAELSELCRRGSVALLHFSTDYVFDGSGNAPYRPGDALAPQNAYGRTKAEGEAAVRESGAEHLVVRTSWVYAPWGHNFVRTIARLAPTRKTLRVIHDQRGRPSSAEGLASNSLRLFDAGIRGIAQVTDGGEATWCELAAETVRLLGSACEVQPCSTAEYPRPAARPSYSVLSIDDTERVLGPLPDWRTCLARVVSRLEP